MGGARKTVSKTGTHMERHEGDSTSMTIQLTVIVVRRSTIMRSKNHYRCRIAGCSFANEAREGNNRSMQIIWQHRSYTCLTGRDELPCAQDVDKQDNTSNGLAKNVRAKQIYAPRQTQLELQTLPAVNSIRKMHEANNVDGRRPWIPPILR